MCGNAGKGAFIVSVTAVLACHASCVALIMAGMQIVRVLNVCNICKRIPLNVKFQGSLVSNKTKKNDETVFTHGFLLFSSPTTHFHITPRDNSGRYKMGFIK